MYSTREQPILWRKYGLSIDESIRWGGKLDAFARAVVAHNMVSDYLERHPEEYEAFKDTAHYGYVYILRKAEEEAKLNPPAS